MRTEEPLIGLGVARPPHSGEREHRFRERTTPLGGLCTVEEHAELLGPTRELGRGEGLQDHSELMVATCRSQSPMSVFTTIGRPAARHSPTLVGEDARFDGLGMISEIAASEAVRIKGNWPAGAKRISKSVEQPPPQRSSAERLRVALRQHLEEKPGDRRRCRATKNRIMSSVRYQVPSFPTYVSTRRPSQPRLRDTTGAVPGQSRTDRG